MIGMNGRDLLLHQAFLNDHRLLIRAGNSLLEPVPVGRGGTVQGLPPSGLIYGSLTPVAATHVGEVCPPVAVSAHAREGGSHIKTYTGNVSAADPIDEEKIIHFQDVVESCICGGDTSEVEKTRVLQCFADCGINSERAILFDATGSDHGEVLEAIVDDVSFNASCPVSNNEKLAGLHQFAKNTGVVYSASDQSKATIIVDGAIRA